MARLNEPIVSTDSIESLRRKFLRQNRDIARINSTQSLKIRSLENECARLLSENLELRGNILRLETELRGSRAQRVADHALEIKEKMEAQLVEWGAMLASLGHEPVPKDFSPRAHKRPRIQRSSIGRPGMSDWRRRDTMGSIQDLEAAALQEGRLPPIWETKTYPRETLNRDEILALCSEAMESTDSPDIGPPPVSRFVDEDPVKLDLTTLTKLLKPALGESENSGSEDTCPKPKSQPDLPAPSTKVKGVAKEEPKVCRVEKTKETTQGTTLFESQTSSQAAKALKRKAREEDDKENAPVSIPLLLAGKAIKAQPEKVTSAKTKSINRPIKELPTNKKDSREKTSTAMQRKPLGIKSSNEVFGSPRKSAKAPAANKGEMSRPEGKDDGSAKNHSKPKNELVSIEIPELSLDAPVDIEPGPLSAEPNLAVPDSPEPSVPREDVKDTPPPVDISSKGETARGSRRARAAVSYAEPNLRDKMRRPNTKQVFDAVAGDGKNVRRTSQSHRDEPPSGPSSVAKSGGSTASSQKNLLFQTAASTGAYQDEDIMASPSAQKSTRNSALEDKLSTSDVAGGKRIYSWATTEDDETSATTTKPPTKGANRRLEEIAAREAEVAKMFHESDVYEFTDNDSSKESTPEEKGKKSKGSRQSRSRRLSSITREDLQLDDTNHNEKVPSKQTVSRKRASMAAIKPTRNNLEDTVGGSPSADDDSMTSCSTAEGEGQAREKASNNRRRSMML